MRLFIFIIIIVSSFLIYDKFSYLIQTDEQKSSLIYSLLLLSFLMVTFSFKKISKSTLLKNILIWIGIFLSLAIIYSYRYNLKSGYEKVIGNLLPSHPISINEKEVRIHKSANGHYQALGYVNGHKIQFLVDTGASAVVLTKKDAMRAGIKVDQLNYNIVISTANGTNNVAFIKLKQLKIGNIVMEDVKTFVSKKGLNSSLLGMSFLNRLNSFKFKNDELILNIN